MGPSQEGFFFDIIRAERKGVDKMPFCTTSGSKVINWDITYDRYDTKTGDLISKGNGLPTLVLTNVEHFDFQPNGEHAQELVLRGQPNPVDMNFRSDSAVFRILTNKFTSGFEANDPATSDWHRFMRDYEREINPRPNQSRTIFFEPSIEDIRVDKDRNFHFPLWVIDRLIALGQFDEALRTNKINDPTQMKLRPDGYERIMKEIELRRAESKKEAVIGNVSGSPKSSKS